MKSTLAYQLLLLWEIGAIFARTSFTTDMIMPVSSIFIQREPMSWATVTIAASLDKLSEVSGPPYKQARCLDDTFVSGIRRCGTWGSIARLRLGAHV